MNERAKALAISVPVVVVVLALGILGARLTAATTGLEGALSSGTITLVTAESPYTFYRYRDDAAGLAYDFAAAFAASIGVELRVVTAEPDALVSKLERTRSAFATSGVTTSKAPPERILFTEPYMTVSSAVVVRASEHGITSFEDLSGHAVHVRAGSAGARALAQLRLEESELIVLERAATTDQELVEAVASRDIFAAVVDSHVGYISRRFTPTVRLAFSISEEEPVRWAVKSPNRRLLRELNRFIRSQRGSQRPALIKERYYDPEDALNYVELTTFHERVESRLPEFQPAFEAAAAESGFDWRLIAAMAYQESHWDPRASSFAGARGIMQLTRRTARELGISNRLDPKESIRAGVEYLSRQYRRFEGIENERDRISFALAAYNIGYGHVRDAQAIAEKLGYDPEEWHIMEKALPLLSVPEHYKDAEYGYARGEEPLHYVRHIWTYFEILRQRAILGEIGHPGGFSHDGIALG